MVGRAGAAVAIALLSACFGAGAASAQPETAPPGETLRSVWHLGRVTGDLDRIVDFYCDGIGLGFRGDRAERHVQMRLRRGEVEDDIDIFGADQVGGAHRPQPVAVGLVAGGCVAPARAGDDGNAGKEAGVPEIDVRDVAAADDPDPLDHASVPPFPKCSRSIGPLPPAWPV